jgi:phenylacetate-CoA ligase
MAILDPRAELADRETIRQVQLERLQSTVNRAYRNVAFYREVFEKAGLQPEDIRSLNDLARLPLTTRNDLVAHQPYAMFAVPLHDVIRLHAAAGAGGPVVVGYTRNDIDVWNRMTVRAFGSVGIAKDDVFMITLDYALDPAALGTQSGAETLGASVIPCSGLAPDRQVEVMRNYRATALAATPSQALRLARVLHGCDIPSLPLRVAFIVGEIWSDELRDEIESLLGVKAYGSFGLSEMAVPGLATECEAQCGLHLSEDNVLAEVVDPETGETLPHGQKGELVLTTLTREAVPLLRYRTGDITTLTDAPCACGRTFMRMSPTHARADDVLMVDGVRVWPDQVEEVVRHFLPDAPCRLVSEGGELEVRIGLSTEQFGDRIRELEALREHIRAHVYERLGLSAMIRLVEPPRPHR